MTKGKTILTYGFYIILGTFFLFLGLFKAKAFLAPLATAVILALLMVPLAQKMESGAMNRISASLLNTFILFLISVGFIALISLQVKRFMDDYSEIQQSLQPKIEQLKGFVLEHTPLSPQDLENANNSLIPFSGTGDKAAEKASSFFTAVMGFFGSYLLTFIYIFFLLNYRHRFREFLIRLFPKDRKKEVNEVIVESSKVAHQYLIGKLLLILTLAVLYAIGLGISGVNNFILISILAALFSLIPYIGNIIGYALAIALGFLTSGESGVLIGISITFAVAQFVESYILEPYIVGDKVDLHPFFVILVVVLGNLLWGIIGMILAIPILAIINVVFIHIKVLHPFGFLLSKED